jgi:hypothetical protein
MDLLLEARFVRSDDRVDSGRQGRPIAPPARQASTVAAAIPRKSSDMGRGEASEKVGGRSGAKSGARFGDRLDVRAPMAAGTANVISRSPPRARPAERNGKEGELEEGPARGLYARAMR